MEYAAVTAEFSFDARAVTSSTVSRVIPGFPPISRGGIEIFLNFYIISNYFLLFDNRKE